MKNRIASRNQRLLSRGWVPAATALALLSGTLVSALADGGGSGVIPPEIANRPYGHTYAEWLVKWWQWSLAFPVNADPEYGTADISASQSGQVWFLPKPLGGGTGTVIGNVPAGKAMFVPVLTFEADNTGCPTYTDFTAAQLSALAEGGWGTVTATSCSIDGVAVAGMENSTNSAFLTETPPFSYTVASHDNVLANYPGFVDETCIPDGITVYPTVAIGVCVLIHPLPVGSHSIHIAAANPTFGIAYDLIFNITVTPGREQGDE